MTSYVKGARFENDVKKRLEEMGFFAVRSAGSHGVADVVAIGHSGKGYLIQCKKNGVLAQAERDELCAVAKAYECVPVLAYREGKSLMLRLFRAEVPNVG